MTGRSSREGDARARLIALSATLVLGLGACTYDFDQFQSAPDEVDQRPDAPDQGPDAPDDSSSDAAPDLPDDGTPPAPTFVLGGTCEDDDDCPGGACVAGVCALSCAPDEDDARPECPEGSACVAAPTARDAYCMVLCDDDSACAITGRDDLSCVQVAHVPDGGLGPRLTARQVCHLDSDDDGVMDPQDNCPSVANPTQRDSDLDGVGDACDDAPRCHPAHESGRLAYPAREHALTSYGLPQLIYGDTLSVFGGIDAQGAPSDAALTLSRTARQWSAHAPLLYPAAHLTSTIDASGSFALTPGQLPDEPRQVGRLLRWSPDAPMAQRAPLTTPLYDPIMATSLTGTVYLHASTQAPETGSTSWTLWRVSAQGALQQAVAASSGLARVPWHVTTGRQGDLLFYSSTQVSPLDGTAQVQVVRLNGRGQQLTPMTIPMPTPNLAQGPLEPLLIEGDNGLTLLMDRRSGQMYRLDPDLLTLARVPALDITIPVAQARFVRLASAGFGFLIVGQRATDPTQLEAYEINLDCRPGVDQLDTDADGVPDLRDVCPLLADPDQLDTDGDGLGDACAEDDDGDGIPDGDDLRFDPDTGEVTDLSKDTNNNGIPNVEELDNDSDGIPDARDRWPLDTSNNQEPNRIALDDDLDGFEDATERLQGTDPLNPLSFQSMGYVAYVRRDSAGARQVEVARLDSFALPQVALAEGEPHRPQLTASGASVIALDGAPGAATQVLWRELGPSDAAVTRLDLGAPLRAAATTGIGQNFETGRLVLTQVVAARRTDAGRWALGTMEAAEVGASFTPLLTSYAQLADMVVHASRAYFLAAPSDCDACATAYSLALSNPSSVSLSAALPLGAQRLAFNGGVLAFGVPAEATGGLAWQLGQSPVGRPPGVTRVESVAPMSDGISYVLSGAAEEGPYALWFFNGRTMTWYRLLAASDDLIEVDWKR